MKIIGLSGFSRSGKDTVGRILNQQYGFNLYAFADALREKVILVNPIVPDNGGNLRPLKDWIASSGCFFNETIWDWLKANTEIVPILQEIGNSERLKDANYWIKQVAEKIIIDQPKYAVITDVRCDNEFEWIKSLGGEAWIVNRGLRPVNNHPVESQFLHFKFDRVINNTGSTEQLISLVVNAAREYLGFVD